MGKKHQVGLHVICTRDALQLLPLLSIFHLESPVITEGTGKGLWARPTWFSSRPLLRVRAGTKFFQVQLYCGIGNFSETQTLVWERISLNVSVCGQRMVVASWWQYPYWSWVSWFLSFCCSLPYLPKSLPPTNFEAMFQIISQRASFFHPNV